MRRFEPRKSCNAPHQGYRADNRAAVPVLAGKGGKAHARRRAPRPDEIGRQQAGGLPAAVDGMVFQDGIAQAHQVFHVMAKAPRRIVLRLSGQRRHMRFQRFAQHVVRLGQAHGLEILRLGAHNADMPEGIRYRDVKTCLGQPLRKNRIRYQVAHQGSGVLAVDASPIVTAHNQAAIVVRGHGAKVHAKAHASPRHLHAHARGLQRAAPGIAGCRIIAKNA